MACSLVSTKYVIVNNNKKTKNGCHSFHSQTSVIRILFHSIGIGEKKKIGDKVHCSQITTNNDEHTPHEKIWLHFANFVFMGEYTYIDVVVAVAVVV